jgi:hypothetical protein
MLTQEDIEEFFYNMIQELREINIPILNDYKLNFKDYPTKDQLKNMKEEENKEDCESDQEPILENL